MSRSARLALVVAALTSFAPAAASAQGASSIAVLTGADACVAQAPGVVPGVPPTAPATPDAGCTEGHGLLNARGVIVAADGRDAYVVAGGGRDAGSNAIVSLRRDATTGALRPTGCVSHDGGDGRLGSDGLCVDGNALEGASAVAMSPDGRNVYVGAASSTSVGTFARDPETGTLTQTDCEQTYRRGSGCEGAPALDGVDDLAVSPDGRNVYATAGADGSLVVFDRDPATGDLAFTGCVSDTGTDGTCQNGTALRGAHGVQVTPDGSAVYVTATMGAVTTYARDPETGAVTPSGCLLDGAPAGGACTAAPALAGARSLTLSPDGAFAYVAGAGASTISILRRGATPTDLTPVGCVLNAPPAGADAVDPPEDDTGDDGDDGGDDADPGADEHRDGHAGTADCAPARALLSVSDLKVSADGGALFALSDSGSLAAFRRDRDSGALTQTGCAESVLTYRSCSPAPGLSGAGIATSGDGRSVYVAGGSQVTAFGAAVAVAAVRARLAAHGRLALRLTCPRARRSGCRGRVGVAARGARTRAYRLAAGRRRTLTITVPARARRTTAGRRLRLRVRATDARHVVRATERRIVLRR